MRQSLPVFTAMMLFVAVGILAGAANQTPLHAGTSQFTGVMDENPSDVEPFSEHFIFDNVTYPDGTTGSIYASMKVTRDHTRAVASYFDADDGYMGQYREVGGFASTDADEVRDWAVEHYTNRK